MKRFDDNKSFLELERARFVWSRSPRPLKRGFATGLLLVSTAYYEVDVYCLTQMLAHKEQVSRFIVK